MRIIFADNFRGFSKTFIHLKDVNFLVGENSSGKSSILALLQLVSEFTFLFDPDFNTDEVKLGNFEDIVSIRSRDRSYFSVGLIHTVKVGSSSKLEAFLLTFTQREGRIRPSFYAYYRGGADSEFRIRLQSNTIRYKRRQISVDTTDPEVFMNTVFKEWISAFKSDRAGYRPGPRIRTLNGAPLSFISAAVEQLERKDPKKGPITTNINMPASEVTWLAPIRSKPERTYSEYALGYSPEGSHTPYLIKRTLERKSEASEFRRFLKRVGGDTGLFDAVRVKPYGRGATAPFELDVILDHAELNVSNVGYGVSQALPVIVEMFARPKETSFAIQQPEVHLHPRAQAAVGDVIFELAVSHKKTFCIETHSDYVIDRYRVNCKKKRGKAPDAQILFFQRTRNGNKVFELILHGNGDLPKDQPSAYRRFFIREQLKLLDL
jgi:hypothetical protein